MNTCIKKIKEKIFRSKENTQAFIALAIVIIILVSNLIKSLAPANHSDPLYYHLFVAWEWGKAGRYIHFEHQPWYLQSGIYEYWMAVCARFFERKEAFHAAMQFMHYFFGGVLSSFLIFQISKKYCDTRFALLSVLLFLGVPVEKYILMFAKNDGFLLFLLIAGLYFYQKILEKPSLWLNSLGFSFCLSLALATKHNSLFFILPWVLVFGFSAYQNPLYVPAFRNFVLLSVLFLPLSFSTLFRNFYLTGNPFFPAMYKLFPAPHLLHPRSMVFVDEFTKSPAPFLVSLFFQFKHYVFLKPIFIFSFFSQKHILLRHIKYISLCSLIMFAILTGKGVGLRFGFFFLALFSISSAVWLYEFSSKRYLSNIFFWVVLIFGIGTSGIEVSIRHAVMRGMPIVLGINSFEKYLSENYGQYDFHKWIAKNLDRNIRILSPDHDMRFYLDREIYSGATSYIACEVADAKTYEKALEIFKRNGFTHLQIEPNNTTDAKVLWQNPNFSKDFSLVYSFNSYELWKLNSP